MHENNCFITLTYNDENLPHGETLVPQHFTKFIKRMRKNIGPMRYYHCGEYGDQTTRPHYHACLFGYEPPDPELFSVQDEFKLYTSKELSEVWGLGHATYGELSFETAAYTARYCTKKITGDQAQDHYTFIDGETGEIITKQPEYATMSRRPGIGKTWLDKYGQDTYEKDEVILRSKAMKPPRFYDKRFEHTDPQTFKTIKTEREESYRKKYGDTPWYRDDLKTRQEEKRRLHAGKVIATKKSTQRDNFK